jgi:hypothetical protein
MGSASSAAGAFGGEIQAENAPTVTISPTAVTVIVASQSTAHQYGPLIAASTLDQTPPPVDR